MEEQSMIERVAEAIQQASFRMIRPAWDSLDPSEKEQWMMRARAALAAIRIPSKAMLDAAPDLLPALKSIINYMPTEAVECRGDKCRLPWCISCYGDEDAASGLAKAREETELARAVIAKAEEAALNEQEKG